MIYCDGCTRILDEDVQFCPYCNKEDTEWQINTEPEPVYKPAHVFRGSSFDKLREINRQIEDNPPVPEKKPELPKESPGAGLYIGMVIVATCCSPASIVIGLVLLAQRNENYRALGIWSVGLGIVITLITVVFWITYSIVSGDGGMLWTY